MKKGVQPYGKRGGPTLPLLEPTPDQVSRSRQPTVPRGTTSSLEELDLCIRSGEPKLCVRSITEPNSGVIESTRQSSAIESGEYEAHSIEVGSKRLIWLRLNNNFCPIQSLEVDNVCRGATERRITFVIRSGSIHQLKHHSNNKIRVYQYQF
jgi:hypothetical protein